MASKSELLNAQGFSRRRLLTAFVSGAPGGRELEPAKPLRGVIAGVALTVLVLLVGLFLGFLQKGLPDDWGNGKLIIDQSTGSRYVTINSELWPVLNVASARLVLDPASSAKPIVTNSGLLQNLTVRDTIGIAGAPDTMPLSSKLVNSGWSACVADSKGGIDARISSKPNAKANDANVATVVKSEDQLWVIANSLRMRVPATQSDGILRDIGLSSATVRNVSTTWLNLFQEGAALSPIQIANAGAPVKGSQLRTGDVVTTSAAAVSRYLVMQDGSLAKLSPLAFALYQHGTSYSPARTLEVAAPDIEALPNSTPGVTSRDWPDTAFTAEDNALAPCAVTLEREGKIVTGLGSVSAAADLKARTSVEPGTGALVSVAGFGQTAGAMTVLIDATATTFAVPGADAAVLAKLGYKPTDVGAAPAPWLTLFRGGPDLTQTAAGVPGNVG